MRPSRLRRNSSAAASASRAFSQRGQRSRKSTAARVPSSSSNAGLTPPSSGYWRSTCAAKEWMVPISIRSSSESTWRPRPRAAVGSPKSSSPPSSSSTRSPATSRASHVPSRSRISLAARTVNVSARSREGSVPAARRLWRRSRTTRVVCPCPRRPRSTTRRSWPHDLPVPRHRQRPLRLPAHAAVVLPADPAEIAVRAVSALLVRDAHEEPPVADERGKVGDGLLDVVAAPRPVGGEEATREAFLADLVHGRVAAQVLVDELEDRLRGDGSANAVTRRNRGGERQVERRLELLAAARLGGERGLPVVVEAALVVDDAQQSGTAVP